MAATRTIIFDLDGTLIHSAPDLHAAVNVALAGVGRAALDLPTVISFIGNGVDTLMARSLRATGGHTEPLFTDALARFHAAYDRDMTTLTRPYPGVLACLTDLKAAGARLGVCTNKPTAPARAICRQLGLSGFFDVIQGAAPEIPKKPDPAPLLAVVDALGDRPDRTLYVGDSVVDYQTALNAAVPFRLFSGGYPGENMPDLRPEDRFADWHQSGILTGQGNRAHFPL